jgi:4-diphosphocytidyl-2-C-methyl-D-erythritol kinase
MRDGTASIERLRLEAPAKVNLTLRVLGARSDGYHDLESVVAAVSLFDTLEFEAAPDLKLTCEGVAVPSGNENLVMKAARRLVAQTGCRKGAHIRLKKRIPAGGEGAAVEKEIVQLKLTSSKALGNGILLRYEVVK